MYRYVHGSPVFCKLTQGKASEDVSVWLVRSFPLVVFHRTCRTETFIHLRKFLHLVGVEGSLIGYGNRFT